MKPRSRVKDVILEPKKFFSELYHVISWYKVIIFLIVVVFFVQIGMFIHEKRNPIQTNVASIETVKSPFTNPESKTENPSGVFNIPSPAQDGGNAFSTNVDVSGIFDEKTKGGTNLPPVARAKIVTTSQTEGIYEGDTIFLSAADSYDPDGKINEFRWDFDQSNGIGIDATGVNATTRYQNAGVYTITLLVIDDKGEENTTSLSITVNKKPETKPNGVIQGMSSNLIDFDSLNFTSRTEIQNAVSDNFANFQTESYAMLAQSIYNSQQQKLPDLPSLSESDLSVGKEDSNTPPVIDSVNPKENKKVYEKRPIISAGFYGNNEMNTDSIELTVDGVPVTTSIMKNKFGVQYTPENDLALGQHTAMLVIEDQKGLRTVKSWNFDVVDQSAGNDALVPKYEDKQGPQIILHNPDENAKNVKPDAKIMVSYDEPANKETVEVAVVDMSTNVSKFFKGNQLTWNAEGTRFEIQPNENIFEYNRSYQIVTRQEDEKGNKSDFSWYVLSENYNAPEVKITSPENASKTNVPDVTVKGFTDPTFLITVNDTVAMVDANGAFSAKISLKQGDNDVVIKAKDLQGKESTQSLKLTYDPTANGGNPILVPKESPIIMDASIKDKEVTDKVRPQISFVFADTDGVDTKSVKLSVDGKDVTPYSFVSKDTVTYKPLEDLAQGEHKVELIVADTKGNTTKYNMSFNVDAYPDQPLNLVASLKNNNKEVFLAWSGVKNITNAEYRIYRSASPNVAVVPANEVQRGLKTTSWTDTNVLDGTTYYYVVAAVTNKNDITGKPSNEIKIKVDATAPILKITQPEKNLVTKENVIKEVGLTEKGMNIEVFVNFKSVGKPKVDDNSGFEQQLTLIPGENVITTVAKDANGNETVDVRTVTYEVPDKDAPYPTDKQPMGTNVPVNTNISVTYNEPVNPDTFKMILKAKDSTETVVPITTTDIALQVSKDKQTFVYNPPADLKYEQVYSVQIEVKDLEGNESINDDWDFQTENKGNPILTIITPEQDFLVDRTLIDVTGKTEPNIDVLIRVSTSGGEAPKEYKLQSQADGSFLQNVALYPYKGNTITVTATNSYGKATTQVIQGVSSPPDTEKPALTIKTPDNNATIKEQKVEITGTNEKDVTLVITVNGTKQYDFKNTAENFSKNLVLARGQNLIKVVAIDAAGNQSEEIRTVFVDDIAPLLQVANPIDGLTTNQSKLELRGMTERSGVVLTVNLNSKGEQNIDVLPDGTFSKPLTLSTGNNYIVVKSVNNLGNQVTQIRTVYYDPVGGVSGASANGQSASTPTGQSDSETALAGSNSQSQAPVTGQATNDVIDPATGEQRYTGGDNTAPKDITYNIVNGTATTSSSMTVVGTTEPEANVKIYLNGIYVTTKKADVNTGKFTVQLTGLQQGQNIVISQAQDASGNAVVRPLVITRNAKGPSLNIIAPMANAAISENQVVVYGVTNPNSSILIQLGNSTVNTVADSQGYFSSTIATGGTGNKTLTVTSTDSLGNSTTKSVPLSIDVNAPALTIKSLNGKDISSAVSSTPNGSKVTVGTTVSTLVGTTEPNTTVYVVSNGSTVGSTTSTADGAFSVTVGAKSGVTSNIQVVAESKGGIKTSRYFQIAADKMAPSGEVYITEKNGVPTASGVVSDDGGEVKVIVRDQNGKVIGEQTTSSNYSITLPKMADNSKNHYSVEFVDSAGNGSRYNATFNYKPLEAKPFDVTIEKLPAKDTTYTSIPDALKPGSVIVDIPKGALDGPILGIPFPKITPR